jgi:hypothetical protein
MRMAITNLSAVIVRESGRPSNRDAGIYSKPGENWIPRFPRDDKP